MFFLESPWPILIVGLVAEALLAVALFRTGRGKLLWPIGGVALLVLLGLVAERYTVTDTKLVRQTLDAAAAGLVANDKDRVKACIVPDPDGDPTRAATDEAFRYPVVFRRISISDLDVKFNDRTSPPTADATFMVYVTVRVRGPDSTEIGEITKPVNMKIKLRKHSGRWLVYGQPVHNGYD